MVTIDSLGAPVTPNRRLVEADTEDAFREYAEALFDTGGVDLLVVEPFRSMAELQLAVQATRLITTLPIVTQATINVAPCEAKIEKL